MEEVMEMIRKYEKKIGSEHVNIKFFSDGKCRECGGQAN